MNKTDYWWSQLSREQQFELRPRPVKRRCFFCKQIEHSEICNELRPHRIMPFGRYKGKPLDELPKEYVRRLGSIRISLTSEIRDELYDLFGVVVHECAR